MDKVLKKFLLGVILVVITAAACKKPAATEQDILKATGETDQNVKSLKMKSMDGFPDPEKRKFNGWYDGADPKLLLEEYYGDSARVFTRYYLQYGALIFVYKETYSYNAPVWLTEDSARKLGDSVWYDDKKTILTSSSYFFVDNKLSKWYDDKGKLIADNTKNYAAKQDELIGNCVLMVKILKSDELTPE